MALFSGEECWFDYASKHQYKEDSENIKKPSKELIQKKMKLTKGFIEKNKVLYQNEVKGYSKKQTDTEKINLTWLDDLIDNGTYQDKVSSLALKVSFCSLHSLDSLDILLDLSRKKYREAKIAIDALKELFTKSLLPPDRSLIQFSDRPLVSKDIPAEVLICWLLEDSIRSRYLQFLTILQVHTQNSLTIVKKEALKTLALLLETHPEQEEFILSSIVNRLVEKERVVASSVVHLLQKVLEKHYNMSLVIVNKVSDFIAAQPRITSRSVYLGINFLGQIYFSSSDVSEQDLPSRVIDICVICLARAQEEKKRNSLENGAGKNKKKKRQMNRHIPSSKLYRALFVAINRAFPYVKDVSNLNGSVETLFKSCHSTSAPLSIQSMLLLFKMSKRNKSDMGRFYRTLYAKLNDVSMFLTSYKKQFLMMVSEALQHDKIVLRSVSMMKRLLQIGAYTSSSTALHILSIVHDVIVNNKKFIFMFKTRENEESMEIDDTSIEVDGLTLNVMASDNEVKKVSEEQELSLKKYDASKRDPAYAYTSVNYVNFYELVFYVKHFSPDVASLAKSLIFQKRLVPGLVEVILDRKSGSQIDFYDTFAYVDKNSSNNGEERKKKRSFVVNTPEFLDCPNKKLRPNQLFYKRYFRTKMELEGLSIDRMKAEKSRRNLNFSSREDFGNEESDDEFAQKLAEDLMRQHGSNVDIDD